MSSTITIQDLVTSARAYPELVPTLGASSWEREPALSIANDVMQFFLSQSLDWKFNRAYAPPFQTISLQQDYVTNLTNIGWLEQAWRIDINNTSVPLPTYTMETVRDLPRTAYQASPFQMSFIPNPLAIFGTWVANTAYPTGLSTPPNPVPYTPMSPIQQFIDANGNILFVTGYGVSGSVQPVLPANSAPGTTVTDNTVTWTVADPNGYAFRLTPLPAQSGIVWQIQPVYQKKPPILSNLQQTIAPVPDEMGYMFRAGFIASCYEHANSQKYSGKYLQWQQGDRILRLLPNRRDYGWGRGIHWLIPRGTRMAFLGKWVVVSLVFSYICS
jgi:hypothetical protein